MGDGRKEVDLKATGDCRGRDTRRKGLPIELKKILDFRDILLVPVFGPGEVPSPFRRAPDLQPVVHPNEEDFLIVIHRDQLTKAAGNQHTAGVVVVRCAGLLHHMVH